MPDTPFTMPREVPARAPTAEVKITPPVSKFAPKPPPLDEIEEDLAKLARSSTFVSPIEDIKTSLCKLTHREMKGLVQMLQDVATKVPEMNAASVNTNSLSWSYLADILDHFAHGD